MGITSTSKQIDRDRIDCDGTLRVTLALSASPDITSNPTDIVLTLDRSDSLAGLPLANVKAGAKSFIDILAESTGGAPSSIGSGSRIGIVSFNQTATADTQLITSVDALKDAVDALTASGSTNHAAAFTKAMQLFDPLSTNAKVIVLFTDGKTTAGPPAAPVAAAARASGIIIYCIGLTGADGIDVSVLNDWATDPDASHVAVTPDAADLEELFQDLAANISKTGATDIVINEVVHDDFLITDLPQPSKGTAEMQGPTSLQWKISELGVTANEGASLSFSIRHKASTGGQKLVNESLTYSDNEGNVVTFPTPSVQVCCDSVVQEPCPEPVDFTIKGCEDFSVFDAGDVELSSLGRILELNFTVQHVCPGKRVALGVLLSEVAKDGTEYPRGMKAFTLPAHHHSCCRDIRVKGVRFVLPEDLSEAEEDPGSMCRKRSFRVRTIAHPVDYDFTCCDTPSC
ncbi:MAG: vWA domain-containing protein [Candidatus Spyradocola sp.]|jgi:Ca-activated chloride channel family protein